MTDIDYMDTYAVAFDASTVRALDPSTMYSMRDTVAIVTGPGGGLGRWIAAALGAAGASLFLVDEDQVALEHAASVLREAGIVAETLHLDITRHGAPDEIVDECSSRFDALDILVNCAGVNRRMPILDVDRDAYDFVGEVNLRVPFFLAQASARKMVEQGRGGAIINIGSITCGIGVEGSAVYGATKAALEHLTKTMAIEWARYGVRVNCIAPGFFITPLARPIWTDPLRSRWMVNRTPMGRPGRASELAGLVLLLASQAGSYITGQTMYVDGGAMAGTTWEQPDELVAREDSGARTGGGGHLDDGQRPGSHGPRT